MIRLLSTTTAAAAALLLLLALPVARTPAVGQTPKSGGVLNVMQREDLPQGFAIHETATISSVWPSMPCFNNLVMFDPLKKTESLDTVVGDLAEKWSWQDNNRNLVFFLRKGVKWHDGQPFSSKDVKFTFDMLREGPDAPAKLRLNPRSDWYANIEAIEAPDAHTVVFRLKRPQPSLLLMLASGYTPVYAAHVPPASYRTGCIGTGPFKLKEWRKGEFVEYVKNPDYFVKGRPYLDGLRYIPIPERGTKFAALQAGRLDAAFPGDGTKTIAEQMVKAEPRIKLTVAAQNVNDNLLLNITKPPFNDVRVRRAISLAIDRRAAVQAVHQGGAAVGASMAPKPLGVWGLSDKDLVQLPGYGKAAEEKDRARKLLAEAGFGPQNPLRLEMVTRATPIYIDFASFVINELKQIGVEATLKQIETAQWHPLATRKEYQAAPNLTGVGPDDPDANFYENFACGSPRNYTGYCDEQVMKLIDQQSQEVDPKKRLQLVAQIQKKLEEDAARPTIDWRLEYYLQWDYVKNLVPHQSIYNWGRMQEVWLDK
jgi:peptide/nickel transport system substrate-binding protein